MNSHLEQEHSLELQFKPMCTYKVYMSLLKVVLTIGRANILSTCLSILIHLEIIPFNGCQTGPTLCKELLMTLDLGETEWF